MKKTYEKPEVYFESFELSTSIAASCANPIHNMARDICGLEIPDVGAIFLNGIQGCKDYKVNDGAYNFCYHNPTDQTNLFNSL